MVWRFCVAVGAGVWYTLAIIRKGGEHLTEYYDRKIAELQQETEMVPHLRHVLDQLREQQCMLEKKVSDLEYDLSKEQADVDRLEGRSFLSLLYGMLGRRDEQLQKERAELSAAVLKCDSARGELNQVRAQIEEKQRWLNCAERASGEYKRLMQEKRSAIIASGGAAAQEILELQTRIAETSALLRELSEAEQEGARAGILARDALEQLSSAMNWSTLDLFSDSLLADIAKYSAIDDARERVEALDYQLKRFRAELSDVIAGCFDELSGGGFPVMDVFFDNIFSDIASRNRIERSRDCVYRAQQAIESALDEVRMRRRQAEQHLSSLRAELEFKTQNTKA